MPLIVTQICYKIMTRTVRNCWEKDRIEKGMSYVMRDSDVMMYF